MTLRQYKMNIKRYIKTAEKNYKKQKRILKTADIQLLYRILSTSHLNSFKKSRS